MRHRFIALLLASLTLAACSGDDGSGTGNSTSGTTASDTPRCNLSVPPEDIITGRTLTETQARRLEMGERHRVRREQGRLAKACAERAGFSDVGDFRGSEPGPTVLMADGSRQATQEVTFHSTGTRDGKRYRIVVTASGAMTWGDLNQAPVISASDEPGTMKGPLTLAADAALPSECQEAVRAAQSCLDTMQDGEVQLFPRALRERNLRRLMLQMRRRWASAQDDSYRAPICQDDLAMIRRRQAELGCQTR